MFELQNEQINAEKIRVKYAIYAIAKSKPPKKKLKLKFTEVRVCILASLILSGFPFAAA